MQENEYQRSIKIWRDGERNAVNWLTRLLKQFREKRQKKNAELELFRDQFEFETGLDSHGEGKTAFQSAVNVHLQRAAAHRARRLENEEKIDSIGNFADIAEPMEDLPGDSEFEAALIRDHPELKR